jgi:uncharacterized tellurite resistance protein B-like protein
MSFLKRFLGIDVREAGPTPGSVETETVRKIVDALDKLEPQRARYIAAFAYILSRVAHSDLDISSDETRAMESVVVERGGLPQEQAMVVVQMAKTQSLLFGGTENFLVTREFNRIAEKDQKLALLDCLFSIAAVDKSIVSAEDTEIRKISSELGLSHGDFIAVKSRYRDHIEALKKLREPSA